MNNKINILGNLVVIGLGSVGQTFLSMVQKHVKVFGKKIGISTQAEHKACATRHDFEFRQELLSQSNFRRIITPMLSPGSMIVNLSVDVSSVDLMLLCRERNALYVDTCVEPWPGVYGDHRIFPRERSNCFLRNQAINSLEGPGATAIITHGANPGWVSHLVKEGLVDLAQLFNLGTKVPSNRTEWAQLAKQLGVRVIQITERDWQTPVQTLSDEVLGNSWSPDAYISEVFGQPGEIGWGDHEKTIPEGGECIDLGGVVLLPEHNKPDIVKTWTPLSGEHEALLVTHSEAISISSYFTTEDGYRPTCYFAYRPMDEAWKTRDWPSWKALSLPAEKRKWLSGPELGGGPDELGVMLMGEQFGAYWIGSQLSSQEIDPHDGIIGSPTSRQVAAGVLGAVKYCVDYPRNGLLEPDDLDFVKTMETIRPYIEPIEKKVIDWYPVDGERSYQLSDFLQGDKID